MADAKLWKAEDLEKLSPSERTEIIRAGIVTDLGQLPAPFLERVRANVRDHIASTEATAPSDR